MKHKIIVAKTGHEEGCLHAVTDVYENEVGLVRDKARKEFGSMVY